MIKIESKKSLDLHRDLNHRDLTRQTLRATTDNYLVRQSPIDGAVMTEMMPALSES